ncbi:MAG TPA: carboxypeptidase regulatory-like domain-containing protein, partial [Terriglobia bacterium]|nr:carboxypeptidase regulatory-like domain-containing protein [Terriglobia bacterium]
MRQRKWYDARPTAAEDNMRSGLRRLRLALPLFLLSLACIFFAQTAAPPAATKSLHVAGVVLDNVTGKPIEGATVGTGTTDSTGHFSVDLNPGVTVFSVSKAGYNPGKLAGRTLPSNIPSQAVFAITLPADQSWNNLVIRMNPSGAIKGKVLDNQGQPMQDAVVQPFVYLYSPLGVRYRVNLAGGAPKTNDLGVFQIERLDAGDYYLEIRPSSPDLGGGSVMAPVFYPNATD